MLAFESAWRVLMAEHVQIRDLLDSMERALASGSWQQPGPELANLQGLLEQLQAFDSATHRPKGVSLFQALRGKSADTDALLAAHEAEQERCDELLGGALALLGRIGLEADSSTQASEAKSLLREHRALLLQHLDQEDTRLRATAAKWLSAEDCSAIVSSISSVVHAGRRPAQ